MDEDCVYLDWEKWTKLIHNKRLSFTDLGILPRLFLWVREGSEFFMSAKDWAKDFRMAWSELHECFQRLQEAGAISMAEHPDQRYSIRISDLFFKGAI